MRIMAKRIQKYLLTQPSDAILNLVHEFAQIFSACWRAISSTTGMPKRC